MYARLTRKHCGEAARRALMTEWHGRSGPSLASHKALPAVHLLVQKKLTAIMSLNTEAQLPGLGWPAYTALVFQGFP